MKRCILPPSGNPRTRRADRIIFILRFPSISVNNDYRTEHDKSEKQNPPGLKIPKPFDVRLPGDYFPGATTKLLVTENTPETPLARTPAMSLSALLSTTPSSVTFPFFTIIRMGLITGMAYFSSGA